MHNSKQIVAHFEVGLEVHLISLYKLAKNDEDLLELVGIVAAIVHGHILNEITNEIEEKSAQVRPLVQN